MNNSEENTQPKSNKQIPVINIILLIGLVVIYILHFIPGKKTPRERVKETQTMPSGVKYAFVYSDSILVHYEMVKKWQNQLESKSRKLESELAKRQEQYKKDASYFQTQVEKQTISEQSAQEIYQQLLEEEQKIMEMRDSFSNQLAQEEYQLNLILLDTISNFLNRYNQDWGYDYIFSYTTGGSILLANDEYNITNQVIKLLNNEYYKNQIEENE